MVDRVRRAFSDADIEKIAGAYRRWRVKPEMLAAKGWEPYVDEPGFCKAEGLEAIRKFDHVLTPGRYVGAAEDEGDGVPFEEKFLQLANKLEKQLQQGEKLSEIVRKTIRVSGR